MKVTAYKGTVNIYTDGEAQEGNYTRTANAYGETIGEFYDNLLLTAYSLKEELAEWGKEHYGVTWNGTLPGRNWYASFTVPRIITSDNSEESMNMMGRRLDHVNDILSGAFLNLDFAYQEIISGLRYAQVDESRIPQFKYEKKDRKVNYYSPDNTFSKMKQYNFSGEDLDAVLKPFIESGEMHSIIKEYERTQRVVSGSLNPIRDSGRFFTKVKGFFRNIASSTPS